jgi:predicted metal-dependent hydrolase
LSFFGFTARKKRPRLRPVTRLEETHPLPLAEHDHSYCLKRSSARRTLAMRVSEHGEVAVNAPLKLPQSDIDRFLLKHADWLRERLAAAKPPGVGWQSGLLLPWLGGGLNLVVQAAAGRPSIRWQGEDLICAADEHQIEATIRLWYQRQARALLAERLAHHAARAGLPLPPLRLSDARTRWGSLSPKGVVSLNWRLIKAGREELDYVICHELAHFRQRNHSAKFWREVAILFPDYARVRAHLRQSGRRYFEF